MLYALTYDDSEGRRNLYDQNEQFFGELYSNSDKYICIFKLKPSVQYKQISWHLICCPKDEDLLTFVKKDLAYISKAIGDLYYFIIERANDLHCNDDAINRIYEVYVYRKCYDLADQELGGVDIKKFEHIPHIINKYDANISQDELVKRSSMITFLAKERGTNKYFEARLPDYGDPDQSKLSLNERKIRDLPEIKYESDLDKPICKVLVLVDWNWIPTFQHEKSLAALPNHLFSDDNNNDYIMSTDLYRHPLIEKRDINLCIVDEDSYHIMVVCIYKCPE